ncbi:hypothetical protein LJC22_00755 [Desulfosarcina sp. OttesenSCG-928-G10]|nr:hypothetical protein [Desulfosarcina sp. OttesenSCG-928-G10]MDL2321835.1 hypothetical protein [Desulfosarcina sp. OttesenSCG-928-B08]
MKIKKVAVSLISLCLLSASVAWAETPINELPMYGGQHDPAVDKNVKASQDATRRGWDAYHKGDPATAMKRFNQGWMLDRDNPEPYWGFGLIMAQRISAGDPETNLRESIRLLEMAVDKAPDDGRIIGDLAFSYTVIGHYYKSYAQNEELAKAHFETAGALFEKAYAKAPTYPPVTANWSVFYFYTGDYQKAKTRADEAISLGYQFGSDYMRNLEEQLKK